MQVRHLLQTLRQAGGTSRTPNLGRNRWTSFANLWGAAGQVQREALVEVAGERTLLKRKQPGYVLRLRVVAADEQSATIRAAVWAYDTEGGREAERFLIVEDRQVPLNDEFILLDRSQLESPSPTAGPAPPATRPAGR